MSTDSAYCAVRRDFKGSLNPKAYLGPPAPTFKGSRSCSGQEATQQLLAIRCPPLCLTPSWSLGTFLALRLPSDSASYQFSTLLATWCTFIARESSWPFGTWHLPVHATPPSWPLGAVTALSRQLLPRCLRSTSLLGALLTTPHPPRCSMLFDLIVTLLATGDSPSS